jgi:hypothetical protein
LSKINWTCELHILFRDENLGCGKAVSSAISWFFNNVDEGIILEDDCLANNSFFSYCQQLLNYYREDLKIFHINGSNHQFGIKRGFGDYYFSVYPHVWGWATWKRAWLHYDYYMSELDKYIYYNTFTKYAQNDLLYDVKSGKVDTWDIQWVYTTMIHNGVVITPNVNLIINLGFNDFATHTFFPVPDYIRFSKNGSINGVVNHPKRFKLNASADNFTALFVHKIRTPKFTDFIKRMILKKYFNLKDKLFLKRFL